jgi:hypothetical protein
MNRRRHDIMSGSGNGRWLELFAATNARKSVAQRTMRPNVGPASAAAGAPGTGGSGAQPLAVTDQVASNPILPRKASHRGSAWSARRPGIVFARASPVSRFACARSSHANAASRSPRAA